MPLILPSRFRLQPPGPAHIDWNHPLARGLVYYSVGNGGPDLVSRNDMTPIGSATLVDGRHGKAVRSNANSGAGWYSKFDKGLVQTITNAFTISAHCDLETFAANGKIVNIPLTNTTWVAPYATLGMGAISTGDRVYLYSHPGAGAGGTGTRAQFGAGTMAAGSRHYILSRQGVAAEGLINGAVSGVNTNTFTENNVVFGTADTLVQMERSPSSYGEGMTGQIYHVALWNRALSLDEKREFYESPYGLLIPTRNTLYSFASSTGILSGETRDVAGAATIPMLAAAGEASFPNLFPAPSTWTNIAGPGTVDLSDSPPTITVNSVGGTPTSVRKQLNVTVGADYRISFRVATNSAQILLGTTNGGTQYKTAFSSTGVGQFSFEFRATSAAFWVQLQRTTAGSTVLSEFVVQQLAEAPSVKAAGSATIPMQIAAGLLTNPGLFNAAGSATIPMLTATGAAAFVSNELSIAGAVTIPMLTATGTAMLVPQRALAGTATIPMLAAAGASQTRYNAARRLNGSNQYFEWTASTGSVTNRNLAFMGHFRMEITPPPGSGGYYIADFGNLTAGTGGSGRIRLIYDNVTQQFVASTASLDGAQYREARSPVTPIDISRHYFVGVTISATGDVRVILNKTKTSPTGGTIPAASTDICKTFRIGATARTAATGMFTGTVGTWSMWLGSVPTDSQIDLMAEGYYPPNIPGAAPSSVWAMLGAGGTEGDRVGSRIMQAVNSPTPVSQQEVPRFYMTDGTATLPMLRAAGSALFIPINSHQASGGVTLPMLTIAGSATAETEGVRGNWTLPMLIIGGEATQSAPVYSLLGGAAIPMVRATGVATNPGGLGDQSTTFYVSTLTNPASTQSAADQEFRVGLGCKLGDVPAGYIVRAFINGAAVKTQISRRRFWPDGSLKFGEASFLVPVLSAGQAVNVEWRKSVGSWTAQDTGLHSGPIAIVNNMSAEWRALTWFNRPTPTTLGTDAGPLIFRTLDMLHSANAAWIKTVYTGHLVTEWEASSYARRADNTSHPDFAAKLYVRAWGGTASTPRRIEVGFKSMYGWDDNAVPADAFGYQVSWDFLIGGTAIRGSSLGTAGWSNVNGFKGGAHFSFDTSGRMDWFDVATQTRLNQPALVHKHKMDYLIGAKLLPNIDLTNTFDNGTAKKNTPYLPGTRGQMIPEMSDVGERDDITWGLTGWTARTMLAHGATVSIDDTAAHQQTSRTQALAVGAVPCQGYRRDTRGMVSHMPAERVPDSRFLPTLVGTYPEVTNSSYTSFTSLDEAHFPNLAYFNYLTEGSHHTLQLMYSEAGAPATFTAPAYGKDTSVRRYDLAGEPTFPVAHQVIRGQIRGIARHVLQVGLTVGLGHPDDLETVYYTRILEDWCIASAQVPIEEDRWRTGTAHQDNFIYRSQNDPIYKGWMHTLVLHALAAVYGVGRRADVMDRAAWWANFPKLALGGYNDGPDADKRVQSTLFTFDEVYYTINPEGGGTRSPFSKIKQWGHPVSLTYGTDGQTVTAPSNVGNYAGNTIVTPFNSATPTGLTRGRLYYAIENAGQVNNAGGTFKLALTPNGPPVSWTPGASPIVATATVRAGPPEAVAPLSDGLNGGQNVGFGLQMIGALKHFYHSVIADPIVEKAIKFIEPYKIAGGGGWAEKAKWAVTFEDTAPVLYQVFHNGDPVYYGDDEVWSTIPTGTYNGNFTLPLLEAGGAIEFAPGLDGDTKGAFTLPMLTIAGEIEAPELVFEAFGNFAIPMQIAVATMTVEAPAADFVGDFVIPMLSVAGAAQFSPLFGFGTFALPMLTAAGEITFANPVVSIEGAFMVPMIALEGQVFVSGVPIQGAVTLPMLEIAGEATAEQFSYEVQGDFVLEMIIASGEGLVDAFELNGEITLPMLAVNGLIEAFVDGVLLEGAFTIPMLTIATEIDNEEMERLISGDFVIPELVLTGEMSAADFADVTGNFTIPMLQSVHTTTPVWMEVPRTRREIWTTISPT